MRIADPTLPAGSFRAQPPPRSASGSLARHPRRPTSCPAMSAIATGPVLLRMDRPDRQPGDCVRTGALHRLRRPARYAG